MYWLYERVPDKENVYRQKESIAIFGYREGLLYHAIKAEFPKALEKKAELFWVREEV